MYLVSRQFLEDENKSISNDLNEICRKLRLFGKMKCNNSHHDQLAVSVCSLSDGVYAVEQ